MIRRLIDWLLGRPRRTTQCFCPKCRLELVQHGRLIVDSEKVVEFVCARCRTTSVWDFGPPAPICRRYRRYRSSEWQGRGW